VVPAKAVINKYACYFLFRYEFPENGTKEIICIADQSEEQGREPKLKNNPEENSTNTDK
jgi:hypothetical protein